MEQLVNLIICQKLHHTHKTNNNLMNKGTISRRGNIAIWLKLERTTNHVKHNTPVSVMNLTRQVVPISDLYFKQLYLSKNSYGLRAITFKYYNETMN